MTGGLNVVKDLALDSTELMRRGDRVWKMVARLPRKVMGLVGVQLNNQIIVLGNEFVFCDNRLIQKL